MSVEKLFDLFLSQGETDCRAGVGADVGAGAGDVVGITGVVEVVGCDEPLPPEPVVPLPGVGSTSTVRR